MRCLSLLSLEWSKQQVRADNKDYLRWLLSDIRLNFHHRHFRLVHGSPGRINEYVYEDRAAKTLSHIAEAADADVLVMGHTHLPYVKRVDGVLFVNDGSVGKHKAGDVRAAYAIYDIGAELKVTIQRVAYDVQAAAEAVRASALPDRFAELLETAGG